MHFTETTSVFLSSLCFCLVQTILRLCPSQATSGNSFQNPSADTILARTPVRKNYLIRIGQSLNLTCPYMVPFYSWTHADQPTKILSDQQQFTILSAAIEDSGRYVCQAVDGYGANSADFAVRVIDPNSNLAQRECALKSNGSVNLDGPCFLTSYSDRDLIPTREWGDSIVLDCDSVTGGSTSDNVHYRWGVIYTRPIGAYVEPSDARRLLVRSSMASSAGQLGLAPSASSSSSLSESQVLPFGLPDLSRYSEPRLKLDRLTLRHNGEYRCSVFRRSSSTAQVTDSISRTFRLVVKPRSDGHVILGPRMTNETVAVGEDVVFRCEVNPDEHRSSTIRWGKSIEVNQRAAYESSGREVIQWAGGTFVVLPSVPLDSQLGAADLHLPSTVFATQHDLKRKHSARTPPSGLTLPNSGAIATESSSSQLSQLFIRQVKPTDAGRYVCSVLTETGRDDHKFVQLIVTGSAVDDMEIFTGGGMKRLTVYIAVPIAVFFVCLCVVTYCLISRRTSRRSRGPRRQRNFYSTSQSQIKSASAASSSSVGVLRNGIGTAGSPWNGSADPRMRPSPVGTNQVTCTVGYSSTNGSNSLNGTGQVVMATQGYQTVHPGTTCVMPSSYPMLLQPMGPQPPTAFYGMSDQTSLPGFQHNPFPSTTGIHNEYVLSSTAMNIYPPGTLYQLSTGHGSAQSAPMGPNVVPSSPESSAITGPGSPVNSESADGRVVYQLGQLGQQSVYPNYSGGQPTVAGANFGFQPQSEFDATTGTNSLISYHPHPNGTHGNAMRA